MSEDDTDKLIINTPNSESEDDKEVERKNESEDVNSERAGDEDVDGGRAADEDVDGGRAGDEDVNGGRVGDEDVDGERFRHLQENLTAEKDHYNSEAEEMLLVTDNIPGVADDQIRYIMDRGVPDSTLDFIRINTRQVNTRGPRSGTLLGGL